MTTIHADPQRYLAVFSPEGVQYSGWRQCEFGLDKGDLAAGWHIREAVMTPAAEHSRLLAIEAAAQSLISGGLPGDPYINDYGMKVRDVLEHDFQRLRQITDAATGEKEIG